ncbi:hypothetical protein THASP1DRAFT_27673 [Thamnocephalis sphaerospora]|uniref:Uncharacterized protein n=1 Tax=Thamnocephalis sphaerospora TaxID=78915 RepID=A0A4V1IXC1_9FUNG|nr:hypothetical protein THASP1DRAFT_27673 [Thamnocephalis sphaerospora]|eukprot:RKP10539.1 hypothetical protein THASP1DRAFT_27673 [Thamnocephalis sphaerospora]
MVSMRGENSDEGDLRDASNNNSPLSESDRNNLLSHALELRPNSPEFQRALRGVMAQSCLYTILFWLFFGNAQRAARLILSIRRNGKSASISMYICLLQACVGIALSTFFFAATFSKAGLPCHLHIYHGVVGVVISSMCVHAVQLEKAYVVMGRSKPLLIAGALFILSAPTFIYSGIWLSHVDTSDNGICKVTHAAIHPWLKFIPDMLSNVVFSACFLHVVLRQHRRFGSDSWKQLRNDGFITMSVITLTNTVAALVAVSGQMNGGIVQWFYLLDWVVSNHLLIRQLEHMRDAFLLDEGRPAARTSGTENMLTQRYSMTGSRPTKSDANKNGSNRSSWFTLPVPLEHQTPRGW